MKIEDRTPPQAEAILTDHARVLVLAGPGSGKTDTVAARVERLISSGVDPSSVVALTYTNEAARNLEDRINQALKFRHQVEGQFNVSLGFAGTLHGYGLRTLRRHGAPLGYGPTLAVIDAEAADTLLLEKAKSLKCKASLKDLLEVKAGGTPSGGSFSTAQLVVLAYLSDLKEAGLIDFDSILTEFLRLLEIPAVCGSDPIPNSLIRAVRAESSHLFVDEVQDSASVDWAIFRALPMANKFLVGDPDQAIFGFRGGRPDLMVDFAKEEGTKLIWLEANFRCGVQICDAANRLIAHNRNRLEKGTYSADLSPATVVAYAQPNEGSEVALVVDKIRQLPPGETAAVLSRTNAVADDFRDALRAAGLGVEEPPAPTAPPDWGLARALVELLANPFNDVLAYFYFVARDQKRGSSREEATRRAQDIRREAAAAGKALNALWLGFPQDGDLDDVGRLLDRDGVCLESRALVLEIVKSLPGGAGPSDLALEVARHDRKGPAKASDGHFCGSIHAAKGREWDHVFVVGFEDQSFPGKRGELEEERRLAFVAITRARKGLTLTFSATRRASWGYRPIEQRSPSRFLEEVLP